VISWFQSFACKCNVSRYSAGEEYSEWLAHTLLDVDTRFAPIKSQQSKGKGKGGGGGGVVALYALDDPEDIDPGGGLYELNAVS
jgi:hypothetical protein